MPRIGRDDVIRRLWLAGFEFTHELPAAHCFRRFRDGAEVLVPKVELLDKRWVQGIRPSQDDPNTSPCCRAPSALRLIHGGVFILRCTSCFCLWERPASLRPALRIVK